MTDLEEFQYIRGQVAEVLSPGSGSGPMPDPVALAAAERLMKAGVINSENMLKNLQIVKDARQRALELRAQGLHR